MSAGPTWWLSIGALETQDPGWESCVDGLSTQDPDRVIQPLRFLKSNVELEEEGEGQCCGIVS